MTTKKVLSEKAKEQYLAENGYIIKWNLVIFAIIQILFEVFTNPNAVKVAGASVVMQYIISYLIITETLTKQTKQELAKRVWIVAGCVFAVRVLLGIIVALVSMLS